MPALVWDADGLPGADLVETGMADLLAGRESVEGLLMASAAERFLELGRHVPDVDRDGLEIRLYALIEAEAGERQAHSRYNALRRRLVSYLRSAKTEADASSTR